MRGCFLDGYVHCGGRVSREHYISRTVLEAISSTGQVQIGGLPWQEANILQSLGVSSLVSNMLCERHNSLLSKLDEEAGIFFRTLNSVDKHRDEVQPNTQIDGPSIERWFLKVICGLVAGLGIGERAVPEEWKAILTGSPWPGGCGLCVPIVSGSQVLATELYVEPKIDPETRRIVAVTFRVAGVVFNLLLKPLDNSEVWGACRPRGLIFREGQEEARVEFVWPFVTEHAIIYTKIGSTLEAPPQWQGWQQ